MPRILLRAFGGGEISPGSEIRFDLAKHQTGVATMENFWVVPQGPAESRPGFEYVNHTKFPNQDARLIEFDFNSEQTYALEFGEGYIRVHTQGGTLLDGTSVALAGITQGVPGTVSAPGHTFVAGQWAFITTVVGMTHVNFRYFKVTNVIPGVSFRIQDPTGVDVDTTVFQPYTGGGTAQRVLEIPAPYLWGDLSLIKFAQSNDVLTLTHPSYDTYELRRTGPVTWTMTVVTFSPSLAAPGPPTTTSIVGPGPNNNPNPITFFYRTTAIAAETLEESNVSPVKTGFVDLSIAGNRIEIATALVPGAARYNVYKLFNGLYSFIAQTEGGPGNKVIDNNLTPDTSKTAPIGANPFAGAGNHPGCVGYYEGRRWFAGTSNNPQKFYSTVSGSESNMNYSIPTQDDDAIYGKLNGQKANPIRHIVPLTNLLFLTSGGEWKLSTPQGEVVTPNNAFPKQDAGEGASHLKPILAGGSVVYGSESSGRLRKMDYKWQSNGYFTDDLSILAPHLFDGFTLRDSAYQKAPVRIVWVVRSDGRLLGITYHPEHDITAWHQHTTQGEFKSSAAIKEGNEFPLYVVVKRTINGQDVRHIERMHTRFIADIADSFCVDAGLTYSGPPIADVSGFIVVEGLWHLVGSTVKVLINGAVHDELVVNSLGQITLQDQAIDFATVKIHVGLGYRPLLRTLGAAWEGVEALAQTHVKNVSDVYLRVGNSNTAKSGPSLDRLRDYPARLNEPYGSPPALKRAWFDIPIEPEWNFDGQIFVVQDDPLPLTVLGWVLDIAGEG